MSDLTPTAFDDLVYALLDGTITESEHECLSSELASSASARRRYLALVEVHDLLEEDAAEATYHRPAGVIPMDDLLRKQRRTQAKRALVAAAAIICVSAVLLKLVLVQQQPSQSVLLEGSPYSEFSITTAAQSDEAPSKQSLTPGSTVRLTQGTLALRFASGVRSVIQAPATVTMVAQGEIAIDEGCAWFHVPEEAVGFQVTTAQVHVTDLGTEFGVVADRGVRYSQDEVHVFKGKVEARALHGLSGKAMLGAGDSVSVHFTGRLEPIRSASERFEKVLPTSLPALRWSFDGASPEQAESDHRSVGEIQTVAVGDPPERVPGIIGDALEFTPFGGHLRTDWRGIDSDRPRTISCWIKCPPQQPTGAMVEWGIPETTSAKWRLNINPESRDEGGIRGALRTEFGHGYVIGTTDLRDGKWHHVVSIYDGTGRGSPESIRMYVDGQPEAVSAFLENEIDTVVDDFDSSPCRIGARFAGSIDELRVIEGVIPAEMVDQLSDPTGER